MISYAQHAVLHKILGNVLILNLAIMAEKGGTQLLSIKTNFFSVTVCSKITPKPIPDKRGEWVKKLHTIKSNPYRL